MAQRGRKPEPPANKQKKGTLQPVHDNYEVIETPAGTVERPEGLPYEAQDLWDHYAPIAEAMGTLKPADAHAFGQWVVMTDHMRAGWAAGEQPPASFVQQWRTLGEMFGLAGEKSRVVLKIQDGESKSSRWARRPLNRA